MFRANDLVRFSGEEKFMKYTQLALILACSISKRQFIPVYYIMQAYTHSTHIFFGWLTSRRLPATLSKATTTVSGQDLNLSITNSLVYFKYMTKL